jgi:DNA repair protein RadB
MRMQRFMFSPNNEVIESLIGNYKSGNLTTIYGNAGSGKTTCCLLAVIESAKNNHKTIFVDTESSFNINRLKQLYTGDINNIVENIFLIHPNSFSEQHDTILKLKKICNNEQIKLVIVNTIGKHYRVVLNDSPKKINAMLLTQMMTLVRIARDLNKIVLVTNQVYANMNEKDELKMVGGNIIPNISKCVIKLHKKDSKRYASVVKYKTEKEKTTFYNLGKMVKFEIRQKGMFLV